MKRLDCIAKEIRKKLIIMHQKGCHIASSLSVTDILTALYFDVMDIKSPDDPDRDIFILSKGHSVSALYVTLSKKGFIPEEKLEEYLVNAGNLYGHPTKGSVPGIEVSTGSLGHGLPVAVGIALAAKRDEKKRKVYVVMGDGESQEGSVWEAAMLAAANKLDNLILIIDANNLQGYDVVDNIQPLKMLKAKFEAFGWNAKEIDGHNTEEISREINNVSCVSGKPSAFIAYTTKGKGIKQMENKLEWHYYSVPKEKVQNFICELEG